MSYDQYAQTFSKSRQAHPWPELEYIIEDMKHCGSQSILDIGCGNGRFLEEIHHSSFTINKYLGIDSSTGMIDEAKRLHPEYDFEVCDIRSLSSLRDSNSPRFQLSKIPTLQPFDSLLLLASFHHLETHEVRIQVLQDMKPLLKEGARVYMTNWNLREQPRYTTSHRGNGDYDIKIGAYSRYYHGFTLDELEELFGEAGYTVVENRIFEGGRNIVSILE